MLARTPTGRSLGWNTDSIHILRRPSSRPQRTRQVSLCTSAARELLVTLRLRLRAIAASNGCPASRLRYYTLNWEAFFVVLVTTVYGVVALQKITSSKAHVASEAFEGLHVGVSQDMPFQMFVSGEGLSTIGTENHPESRGFYVLRSKKEK